MLKDPVWQIFYCRQKGDYMNVNSEAFEMDSTSEKPKEGDLYRFIELHGKAFEIRYGYYEDIDRQYDPMEIYPDFLKNPDNRG